MEPATDQRLTADRAVAHGSKEEDTWRETMPYFALMYELVDDYLARRAAFRQEHLALAKAAHERSEIALAGAFADPPDRALLIFRCGDRSTAESFARNDPYVVNGLVKRWEVRPWTVVIGGAE
jgi:uncharacterized protein YciI